MKKLLAVILMMALIFNLLGVVVVAEVDNAYKFPTGASDLQKQELSQKLEVIADKWLKDIKDNNNLSDVQKALLVHDKIIENSEYDLSYTKRSVVDNLIDGASVCTGYSAAYRFLLDKLGIKCEFETSDVMNHLWNVVYIGGKKYYADLTYDDPLYDMDGRVFHNNFLISSKRFCETHADNFKYDPATGKVYTHVSGDNYAEYTGTITQVNIADDVDELDPDARTYDPNRGDMLQFDLVNNKYIVFNPYTGVLKRKNIEFNLNLNNTEYEDSYWNDSDAAFQLVGNNVYYISTIAGTLMKYGSSAPLVTLSNDWPTDAIYYYPGNYSKLTSDGYCLYYSDLNKIYKYDVKTNVSTTVYALASQYDNVYGLTFKDCHLIFEATNSLNWDQNTKNELKTSIAVPHYYGESDELQWSSDTENHWRQCLICGTKTNVTAHTFGTSIKKDDTTHWYECTVCGVKKDWQEHIYSHNCDAECNACGYTRTPPHYFSDEWTTNATLHWKTCTNCNAIKDKAAHTWDNGVITTQPTCKQQGERTYTCTVCGRTKTEPVPLADHTPVIDPAVAPNCTASGLTEGSHCSVCGTVIVTQQYVAPKGHTPVIDEGVAATCTEPGLTDASHCSVCNVVLSTHQTINPTGHSYKTVWSYNAANHWHECGNCGDKKDIAGHQYDNQCDTTCNICGYERTTAHSYTQVWYKNTTKHWHLCTVCNQKVLEGDHVFDNSCDSTCNTCGYVRTITHSYKTVWSNNGTNHWHECSICGSKKDESTHIFDNACDTTCNTCGYLRTITHSYKSVWSKDGTNHWHECSICGNKKDISAHTWNSGAVTTDPTPDTPGTRTYTCTVCGAEKYESVAFVGLGGHITSFGNSTDAIQVRLYSKGGTTPLEELTVYGNSTDFLFWNVSSGNYTVEIEKKDHISRKYDVTVAGSTVTFNAKIHLLGDINGDGLVDSADFDKANYHVKGIALLTGYEFECADINKSKTITTYDCMLINLHAKGKRSLW